MLRYAPTPVQEIHDDVFDKAGVRVMIKREDLNHPLVSGNKWWKLKYNLEEAARQGKKTLLTFGGAYSNHIYATAAAAQELGLKSIGIIRGEEAHPLNATLQFAADSGMHLQYVSREAYRRKSDPDFINSLSRKFGDFYLIPEGGTNALAVQGVTEFAQSLGDDFDYVCCAVGTGGTLAGLIQSVPSTKKVIGVAVLKGGAFLNEDVRRLLNHDPKNWELFTNYHFGGYAKTTPALISFAKEFQERNKFAFEYVYMAKLLFAITDSSKNGLFNKGSTVLVLHSGGLQSQDLISSHTP